MDKSKERKKRKVEDDDEETEEVKMEKFFALIKSTRRLVGVDRWKESEEDRVKENEEKSKINIAAAGWCPVFQPEDFEINKVSYVPVPVPATQIAGPSTTAEDDRSKQEIAAEKENDILNLKLSL